MKNCNKIIAYFQNFPMSYPWIRLATYTIYFVTAPFHSKNCKKGIALSSSNHLEEILLVYVQRSQKGIEYPK